MSFLTEEEARQALQRPRRRLDRQLDEEEADRYGKICEAYQQLKDLVEQFDNSGMFIVASELRTVEKRVGDVVENLSDIFGMGA